MSTHLFLVRHAEVEERYHRVFGGRIDMNLSARGHQQAESIAKSLHDLQPHAIYASPMIRVQQTLAPLMRNGTPRPTILNDLREVDVGDWTGVHWDSVPEKFGVSAFQWLDLLERDAIPNAEQWVSCRGRVASCLRQIARDHAGQKVLVACHGGVIRMMLAILLDIPLSKTNGFEIEYAGVTHVALHEHGARIQSLNFLPWLGVVA